MIPSRKPRSKSTTVRLNPELRDTLRKIEAKSGLKIAQAIRMGILKVAEMFGVQTEGQK